MTTTLRRMPPVTRAVLALFERDFAPLDGHPERAGGELPGALSDLYVRIERVGGNATQLEGDYVIDVETFHPDFTEAENAALDLEALLLGYPHVIEVDDQKVILDFVQQNQGPSEIFWDDDNVHRLLATYVITVRRR